MGRLGAWLKQKLSRVTSSGQFIPQIDGLRFVAVISVVLFHMTWWLFPKEMWDTGSLFWSTLNVLIGKGYYGVEIFFMISGFILVLPMAKRHLRQDNSLQLKRYFARRISRLEPPYILCLLIYWLFWTYPPMEHVGNLGASMIYAHGPIYGTDSVINHVVWSLEVEIQFYIIAPFLGFVFMVKSRPVRRAIILGAIAGLIWLDLNLWVIDPWISQFRYSTTLIGKGVYFLPGFLLADIYLVEWKSNPPKCLLWDLLGVVGWVGIPVALCWQGRWGIPKNWNWSVLLFQWIAFVGAFRGRFLSRIFALPVLTVIGGMCYTIYLYHPKLISFTGIIVSNILPESADNFTVRFILLIVIGAGLILSVSTLLFVLVEKPCMQRDWPAKLLAWFRRIFRCDAPTEME
ncbi:MAG: acyltransferase [Phycisphaerales bacterium]|jgi:peptidoglycan/LPS O-acetylase OafA/YrhL|nr:acyltransferase [Phycisphaerales bacterium]